MTAVSGAMLRADCICEDCHTQMYFQPDSDWDFPAESAGEWIARRCAMTPDEQSRVCPECGGHVLTSEEWIDR